MKKRCFLALFMSFYSFAGDPLSADLRRKVTCQVRCRTEPDLVAVVKGGKQFYKNGYCGLQSFSFSPNDAKVGSSSQENDTPSKPHYSVERHVMPNPKGWQYAPEFKTYFIDSEAGATYSKTLKGGPGKDGKPQFIDVQCTWGTSTPLKEFAVKIEPSPSPEPLPSPAPSPVVLETPVPRYL